MKMEDKANLPRVRIAVLGHANVGKSGELFFFLFRMFWCLEARGFRFRLIRKMTSKAIVNYFKLCGHFCSERT